MNRKAGKYEEQGSEPDHAAIFAQKFTCGQAKVAGTLAHPGTKVTDAGVQQPRQALANCKVTSSPWLLIARGIAMHDTDTFRHVRHRNVFHSFCRATSVSTCRNWLSAD